MLKTNLFSSSRLLLAVLAAASVSSMGCNLNQPVSVDMKKEAPQLTDSNSGSASQTAGAVGATAAQGETVHIGSIDWYVDYDTAMKVAMESNKPIWLHFGENPG